MDQTGTLWTSGGPGIIDGGICHKEISIERLFAAWNQFKRLKNNRSDVVEFAYDLEGELFQLRDELLARDYRHRNYESFYVHDPKLRHIHKASVRDRVVHHLVYVYMESRFEPGFIYHSYSSRNDKGTHRAFTAVRRALWKLSVNDTKTVWALKCDIKKFFANIDHAILLELVKKRITNTDMLWIAEEIVQSFSGASGKGLPLGNITSQLFANVYMNEFDQYVKRKLKTRHYFRYADDFVVASRDRGRLEELVDLFSQFLRERLQLTIHPGKITLKKWHRGVDFVGYVSFPHYAIIRPTTKERLLKKVERKVNDFLSGNISREKAKATINSYHAITLHANAYKVRAYLDTVEAMI